MLKQDCGIICHQIQVPMTALNLNMVSFIIYFPKMFSLVHIYVNFLLPNAPYYSLSDNSHFTDLSDSSVGHSGSLMSHPLFSDEPLYQFYNASIFEQAKRQEAAEGDSDGYEEIVDGIVKSSRPSAMELIRPREGQHRTLWCEIPEVRDSGVLGTVFLLWFQFHFTSSASLFSSSSIFRLFECS